MLPGALTSQHGPGAFDLQQNQVYRVDHSILEIISQRFVIAWSQPVPYHLRQAESLTTGANLVLVASSDIHIISILGSIKAISSVAT